MKHIYLNLKRFDVPTEFGGVNRIAPVTDWAAYIVKNTQEELKNSLTAQELLAWNFKERLWHNKNVNSESLEKKLETNLKRKMFQFVVLTKLPKVDVT